ncbi:MAG: efflux transporter periplasmic adaptor subunit, partial [Stenotrophomonas sp.]
MIRDTSAQDQVSTQRPQPVWRRWLWPAVATAAVVIGIGYVVSNW